MRHVILLMFFTCTGKEADTLKKSLDPKPDSAIRKALMDPMVVTPDAVASPGSAAPAVSQSPQK
jgi:hypothetical protein